MSLAMEDPLDPGIHPGKGIQIFGFRLQLSTDDFVFPAFFEALNRFVLVMVLVVIKVSTQPEPMLSAYLVSAIVIFTLNGLTALILSWQSSKGIIWDPLEATHRRLVLPSFYLTLLLSLGEIVVISYGTIVTVIQLHKSDGSLNRDDLGEALTQRDYILM